jgi:hypothetical protein
MLKFTGYQILQAPKRLNNKIVFFHWCGDVHPLPIKESPVFEKAELAIFISCNKNFPYYWLRPQIFPSLKIIYTDVFCEDELFRFCDITVYTSNEYKYNKNKNNLHNTIERNINFQLIDKDHFETLKKISENIQ